jgi:hypothetical protein
MWTTGESVLYVFLYYAVLMAIGALMPSDWRFVRSSADTDYDDGLCGECEEPPKMIAAADRTTLKHRFYSSRLS